MTRRTYFADLPDGLAFDLKGLVDDCRCEVLGLRRPPWELRLNAVSWQAGRDHDLPAVVEFFYRGSGRSVWLSSGPSRTEHSADGRTEFDAVTRFEGMSQGRASGGVPETASRPLFIRLRQHGLIVARLRDGDVVERVMRAVVALTPGSVVTKRHQRELEAALRSLA